MLGTIAIIISIAIILAFLYHLKKMWGNVGKLELASNIFLCVIILTCVVFFALMSLFLLFCAIITFQKTPMEVALAVLLMLLSIIIPNLAALAAAALLRLISVKTFKIKGAEKLKFHAYFYLIHFIIHIFILGFVGDFCCASVLSGSMAVDGAYSHLSIQILTIIITAGFTFFAFNGFLTKRFPSAVFLIISSASYYFGLFFLWFVKTL